MCSLSYKISLIDPEKQRYEKHMFILVSGRELMEVPYILVGSN